MSNAIEKYRDTKLANFRAMLPSDCCQVGHHFETIKVLVCGH